MINLLKLSFIGCCYSAYEGYSPFYGINEGVRKSLEDETQRKAIREQESNNWIAPPSQEEQKSLNEIANLEKRGFEIPDFFQFWKKGVYQETVTTNDLEKINHLHPVEQDLVYELFFRYHSYRDIHQPPYQAVNSTDYAINLLWLDQHPSKSQEFSDRFYKVVQKWREGNDCQINLWYHSDLTPRSIIKKSKDLFAQDVKTKFRDLSSINSYQFIGIKDLFFTDQRVPLFLKIDSAKSMILQLIVEIEKKFRFAVFSDLDVKALSKNELFDQRTIVKLEQSGFVLALSGPNGPTDGYENNFMIFDRKHSVFLKTHKEALKQAITNGLNRYFHSHSDKAEKKAAIQSIYSMYWQIINQDLIAEVAQKKISLRDAEQRRILPPVKPISSPPTQWEWERS